MLHLAGRSLAALGLAAGSVTNPPRRGALATRSSTPDSAVSHGESKMVVLEPNHSQTYRVHIARADSERPAVSEHRKPMMAGRCWRRGGVSRRRQHERRRPRVANELRKWKP